MLKLVWGVLALALGAVLICWVAFNLLVSRQPSFQMGFGAVGFMAALVFVGTKWVKEGWPEVQNAVRPKPQKKKRRRPAVESD